MVVQRCHEAFCHHCYSWLSVWLDLVLINERYSFSQQVQYSKRDAAEEIAGEGKQDREKRR